MPKLIIKEVMKRRGITVYRLAQLLKTDIPTVKRFLEPDANPQFWTLARISKALGVGVRTLIRDDPPKR